MVSGAVIIGRPIGPGTTRAFTLQDFNEFKDKCRLGLITRRPFEVALPYCLENAEKFDYAEGVLVNVYGGERTPQQFEAELSKRIIEAGELCEELYCKSAGRAFSSDLHHQKVMWSGFEDGKLIHKPIMQVLATYNRDSKTEYFEIASDLLRRTKEARINRYNTQQQKRYSDALGMLSKYLETGQQFG